MELVVANLEDMQAQLAASFERLAAAAPLACAVSGGPTALILLTALRHAQPDWSRVRLFLTDERADAQNDGESYAAVVRRMLVESLSRPAPRLFPMPLHLDLEEAAAAYDAVLDRELHGDAPDLAIVGLGEDGHLAGLFAGQPALTEQTRVVPVHAAPRPPYRRLTLSLSYLVSCGQIWVVAVGPRKRAVVQAAVRREGGDSPFDQVLRYASDVTIFTDQPLRHG